MFTYRISHYVFPTPFSKAAALFAAVIIFDEVVEETKRGEKVTVCVNGIIRFWQTTA